MEKGQKVSSVKDINAAIILAIVGFLFKAGPVVQKPGQTIERKEIYTTVNKEYICKI